MTDTRTLDPSASAGATQELAESVLLFCSMAPEHSLAQALRSKAIALSRSPDDATAGLELQALFNQATDGY